ncbi:hypothetical protein T229_05210 [Tannerella sp. oral taxon BU063 isolate Cell 5]|uniref:Uncharacterized protein n=1 Tax=Tannerella sp. oral taxon BU063 isolate Cell 5 TaxID=1410950 RepID=W2CF75_9BACT|nr:hypothetical protein T229_05210 [Tannerella sp. oral taxon BU063 isolate Cell 5]
MEKEKKRLVKRFHTLLGKAGIDDDGKRDILSAYGVKSSLDLDCRGLMEVCDRLTTLTTPGLAEADRWRKRVMAAIFSYCREMKREVTVNEVKAIACRAAGTKSFNRIPVDRLRSLYNAFKQRTKDLQTVDRMTVAELGNQPGVMMYFMYTPGEVNSRG